MEEMGSTPGKKKNPQNAMCNRQTGSHQVVSQNLQTLAHNYKVTPFAMKKWPDNRDDLSGKGDKFSSVYYLSASETWLVKWYL